MLENWKSALDKGENIFVLILAKLKASGFSINALDLMRSYLKNQRQ